MEQTYIALRNASLPDDRHEWRETGHPHHMLVLGIGSWEQIEEVCTDEFRRHHTMPLVGEVHEGTGNGIWALAKERSDQLIDVGNYAVVYNPGIPVSEGKHIYFRPLKIEVQVALFNLGIAE